MYNTIMNDPLDACRDKPHHIGFHYISGETVNEYYSHVADNIRRLFLLQYYEREEYKGSPFYSPSDYDTMVNHHMDQLIEAVHLGQKGEKEHLFQIALRKARNEQTRTD